MIVVDANVIASVVLPTGDRTELATRALEADREWVAPVLWRSELRNVLATAVRTQKIALAEALEAMAVAEELMGGGEYTVPSSAVLELASESGCTAYGCEYAALARDLGVRLVTEDRALLRAFPDEAVSLADFVS